MTRADIVSLLSLSGYVDAVEAGFRASATGAAQAPPPLHLAADEGGYHAKAAILVATDAHVAVKVNSNFPRNPACHALPTIQGAIALFDARDGRLLALMDSIEITLFDSTGTAIEDVAAAVAIYEQAMRTGAGTSIAFGGLAP